MEPVKTYKSFAAGYTVALWTAVALWALVPFDVNMMKAQILAAFISSVYFWRLELKARKYLKWLKERREYCERMGYPPPPPLKETDV